MKLSKLVTIEIGLVITSFILALLWVKEPSGNFEPFIVVTGLILGAIELYRRKPSEEPVVDSTSVKPDEIQPQRDLEPSHLTVKDIIDEINELPLFQRHQAAQNYSGISVIWTGYLRRVMVDPRDTNKTRVNLNVGKDSGIGFNFWFSVDLEQFPEIKVLKEKNPIIVSGRISSVSPEGLCVELENTQLSFPN